MCITSKFTLIYECLNYLIATECYNIMLVRSLSNVHCGIGHTEEEDGSGGQDQFLLSYFTSVYTLLELPKIRPQLGTSCYPSLS